MAERAGVKFPKLATLPASAPAMRGDGQVEYSGTGLWLRDNGVWKQLGASYRNQASGVDQPKLWTGQATSDANGAITLALPAGYFTAVHDVQAQLWQSTASASTAGWVDMISMSTTQIVAQTWRAGPILILSGNPTATLGNVPVGFLVTGV